MSSIYIKHWYNLFVLDYAREWLRVSDNKESSETYAQVLQQIGAKFKEKTRENKEQLNTLKQNVFIFIICTFIYFC